MTTLELKTKIHKAIDNVPEGILPEIYDFITSVQEKAENDERINSLIDKIIKEESNLLRRLAE